MNRIPCILSAVLVALAFAFPTTATSVVCCPGTTGGDANIDGTIDISDLFKLIDYLTLTSALPVCPGQIPVLATATISNTTWTTAQCGGSITSDGGAGVTARGVCWSTNPTPTVADNKTTDGAGAGSFTSSITGLTNGTSYFVRAYATNGAGTGYGSSLWFTTVSYALPVIATATVSAITQTTAQCGGDITFDGGTEITVRGVCWSTNPTPTVADDKTNDGTGAGGFVSSVTGLAGKTPYYVRAYATNIVGTSYGSTASFFTTDSTGTITDIDGNTYPTVKIGDQWWTARNLRVGHYRNGNAIPVVTGTAWWDLTTGAFTSSGIDEYGFNYNGFAVLGDIAPAGWHVATDAEWQTLVDFLGGDTFAGGKMKEVGTTHWLSPNTGATNESGFTAEPAGAPSGYYAYFGGVGWIAYFWTSSDNGVGGLWMRNLYGDGQGVSRSGNNKSMGYSVRCVKD